MVQRPRPLFIMDNILIDKVRKIRALGYEDYDDRKSHNDKTSRLKRKITLENRRFLDDVIKNSTPEQLWFLQSITKPEPKMSQGR